MESATDTIQPEVTESAPEVQATEQTPAPETQTQAFDPSKIDPKVKEHFEKEYSTRYQDYEPSKRAAQELNAIKNDPEFQKWIQERNAPKPASPFELTDDQFTAALTDKSQFAKLVQEAAKHLLDSQVRPKLEQTEQHFQLQARTQELKEVTDKFPDFKELDKRGLIADFVQRYGHVPGFKFEDAYWMAKRHTFKDDVAKAARGQVTDRKGAGVEKGNNAPSAKKSVTKVEDRLEAMTKVAEDIAAGREPGDYDWD
jgi:hypothetical protein